MLIRRELLAGLLAAPAALLSRALPAVARARPAALSPGRKVWIILGTNYVDDSDYAYAEGIYPTEYAFADAAAAAGVCAWMIERFCAAEDPDIFKDPYANRFPTDWDAWTSRQKWDWHLGLTPGADLEEVTAVGTGYGCVEPPFVVRELLVCSASFARYEIEARIGRTSPYRVS